MVVVAKRGPWFFLIWELTCYGSFRLFSVCKIRPGNWRNHWGLLAAAPCWNRCHAALERSHQKKFQRAVPSSNLFMSFVPKQVPVASARFVHRFLEGYILTAQLENSSDNTRLDQKEFEQCTSFLAENGWDTAGHPDPTTPVSGEIWWGIYLDMVRLGHIFRKKRRVLKERDSVKQKNQHRINLLYLLVGCNNYKVWNVELYAFHLVLNDCLWIVYPLLLAFWGHTCPRPLSQIWRTAWATLLDRR